MARFFPLFRHGFGKGCAEAAEIRAKTLVGAGNGAIAHVPVHLGKPLKNLILIFFCRMTGRFSGLRTLTLFFSTWMPLFS